MYHKQRLMTKSFFKNLSERNVFRIGCKAVALILVCVLVLGVVRPAAGLAQGPTEWRTAYPTQSAVLDITLTDDGGAWAVGAAGTILHSDGGVWRRVDSPSDETLHAVAFASPDDGWAVGRAGTVLHYQNGTWRSAVVPTTSADELFDITFSGDSGWAVGQRFDVISYQSQGLILHLSGDTWTEVSMPQTEPLYAITFASADQGWAVGKAGTILHWDGVAWTAEGSQTNADLYDVAVVGDDFWAVGENGVLVHRNQAGFWVLLTPHPTLRGVGFAGPDAGWAVGATGTVLHYDGKTWSPVDTPLDADLSGLFVDADGIPWVTGGGGLIGRVTPGGWQFVTQPYVQVDLTAIDLLGEMAGWAVGGWPFQPTDGVVFWQRADERWNPRLASDVPPLFDIDVLSQDEAWAVGQDFQVEEPTRAGVVWHYMAGAWTAADSPEVSALFAVEAVSSADVWVAGQDGALLHYDGTAWERSPMPENIHLYGLHFRLPGDGWAVGERLDLISKPPRYLAVAFHYDGVSWQEIPVPIGPPRLLAVYALAADDVWAVGNLGAILHYDGQRWTVVQGQQDYHLLDVDFAGPDDGWAVGTHGTILRYHDSAWSPVSSPTTETLNGVVGRPWGEAWAVGSQGTFLYHPRDPLWNIYLPLVGR